ncbi:RNHCP domain-containing protein [Tenacibaculum sp. SSH1-16]|uniref:RNHCP domain-containing protein n=1 Tax=Tenacibaculum sp. SSH1-16 TaxID=3136667 RepID=UPI0012E6AFE3|nr:RNHCP domain-containing protein [Tenacibaculum sp. KUL118]
MTRHKILRYNPLESFICEACGKGVSPLEHGGKHRNHCPHCLHSLHLDITPGDRRASCRGIMEPISMYVQKKSRESSIVHRCTQCKTIRVNRIASDDNELLLFTIATEPLLSLPFATKTIISTLHQLSREKGKENEYT